MTTRHLLDDIGIIDRKIRENQSLRNTSKANSNQSGEFSHKRTHPIAQTNLRINLTNWFGRPNASKQTLKKNTYLSPLLLLSVSATLAQKTNNKGIIPYFPSFRGFICIQSTSAHTRSPSHGHTNTQPLISGASLGWVNRALMIH